MGRLAKLVILAALSASAFPAVEFARGEEARDEGVPGTKELGVVERTSPSNERRLIFVRLYVPTLTDRTPFDAALVVRENGVEMQTHALLKREPDAQGRVAFVRACFPESVIAESVIRLRERNHVTGKFELIDFPIADAVEIEKP